MKQDVNYIQHHKAVNLKIAELSLNPTHIALYNALFLIWNNCGFDTQLSINRNDVMKLSKIGSANTYTKCLKDLHKNNLIDYQPSYNPLVGSKVMIYRFDKGSDNGTDKGSGKGTDKGSDTLSKLENKETKKEETEKPSPSQDKEIPKQPETLKQRPEHAKDKYAAGYNKDDLRPYAYMKQQKRLRYEQFYNEFGKHISNPNDFLQSFNDKYDYEGKAYDPDTIYYRLRSFARNWQKNENK